MSDREARAICRQWALQMKEEADRMFEPAKVADILCWTAEALRELCE